MIEFFWNKTKDVDSKSLTFDVYKYEQAFLERERCSRRGTGKKGREKGKKKGMGKGFFNRRSHTGIRTMYIYVVEIFFLSLLVL